MSFFEYLQKEVKNKVRDFTALAGSNNTFTTYYKSNVLPPLTVSSLNMEFIRLFFD